MINCHRKYAAIDWQAQWFCLSWFGYALGWVKSCSTSLKGIKILLIQILLHWANNATCSDANGVVDIKTLFYYRKTIFRLGFFALPFISAANTLVHCSTKKKTTSLLCTLLQSTSI